MKNGRRHEDEVVEGGAERARRTPAGRRRRARIKGQWRGGGGGQLHKGVPQKDGERGRGFRTRLCFQAGSPRSRLSSALIARGETCLTFNRCVFADDDDDDAKAKATRQRRQQHRDFIVVPRPYFIVADCSFVSAPLHPAAGRFFVPKFFVSGPFSASLTASAESSPYRFNQNQTSC